MLEHWEEYDYAKMVTEALKTLKLDLSPKTAENQYYVFKATLEAIKEAGYKLVKEKE